MLTKLLFGSNYSAFPEATNDEIEEDLEEERDNLSIQLDNDGNKDDKQDIFDTVYKASEGALTLRTIQGYQGQIKKFKSFISNEFPEFLEDIIHISSKTPELIAVWIFQACAQPQPSNSKAFFRNCRGNTFSQALKMRSAISWYYAHELRLGTDTFHQSNTGVCSGNPSLSVTVSQYMKSLQREKVRAGEVSQSARAVNQQILRRLFEHNATYKSSKRQERLGISADNEFLWGGVRLRLMMTLAYAIAFLCLLRFDEVLRIEIQFITFECMEKGRVKLELPYRKTHQHGEIKPFYLYFDREHPWLDVPSLLLEWVQFLPERSGRIFRRFNGYDMPLDTTLQLGQAQFLEHFRSNLLDIGIDPIPYGCHSFRRGGVQYLSSEKRWDIRKLCDWGGWSTNFDSLTIVRYLINWNDLPTRPREDFMNPEAKSSIICYSCGRTCDCA